MKTATVRDLRIHFPRLEAWLEEGESISITKRKRVVATLVAPQSVRSPNFSARFGSEMKPAKQQNAMSVVDLLSEERGL